MDYIWISCFIITPFWAYFIFTPDQWPKTQAENISLIEWSKISLLLIVLTPINTQIFHVVIGKFCLKTNTNAQDPEMYKKRSTKDCLHSIEFFLHFLQLISKSVWACYGIKEFWNMNSTNDYWFYGSMVVIEQILALYMVLMLTVIQTQLAFCFGCCSMLVNGNYAYDEHNQKVGTYKMYRRHMSTLYGREMENSKGYESFEMDLIKLQENNESQSLVKNSKYSHYYDIN